MALWPNSHVWFVFALLCWFCPVWCCFLNPLMSPQIGGKACAENGRCGLFIVSLFLGFLMFNKLLDTLGVFGDSARG